MDFLRALPASRSDPRPPENFPALLYSTLTRPWRKCVGALEALMDFLHAPSAPRSGPRPPENFRIPGGSLKMKVLTPRFFSLRKEIDYGTKTRKTLGKPQYLKLRNKICRAQELCEQTLNPQEKMEACYFKIKNFNLRSRN